MGLFNFFGKICGYLLYWLYLIVHNYGVAIILFTFILKLIMFPFSVKQQKSMASQGKLAEKQKEIQKKYANDKAKMSEEMQALYDKEGISPTSGCLTALIPFPIMMGLYYAVIRPLSNVLHFGSDVVDKVTNMLNTVPGIASTFNQNNGFYVEMHIVKHFENLKPYLTMFSDDQLSILEKVSNSFNFFGLDLLGTPKGSAFSTMLWLIPVLVLITSWGQQFYMSKSTPTMTQKGCGKYMLYALPLVSVYFAYIMPGAIGFYWVISSLLGFIQSIITVKFYGPVAICAKAEAQRAALRFIEEEKIEKLPYDQQKKLEEKIYSRRIEPVSSEKTSKKTENKTNKKKSSKNSTDSYLGTKK